MNISIPNIGNKMIAGKGIACAYAVIWICLGSQPTYIIAKISYVLTHFAPAVQKGCTVPVGMHRQFEVLLQSLSQKSVSPFEVLR